ncbi:HPr-rel-A system PqqD family peptide chaperone [Sphingomonas sp.]|jgi:PqqD family protein of HPr-rel-A system|uniref:HPr-rel-A system PqqD family peptide chaperone n=1 Tax=Sphingomonas sp. TaxID=28214 RepID=UPI002E163719|nr:HPr-rel-A system PqqD family peptide chaperone [Sphingomonas sp.]
MTQKIRRNDDVFTAPVDGTILLLNAETGSYHGLSPVASRIWELLADPTDETALVSQLLAEFAVTPEQCAREVTDFLAALRARGLIDET